MDTYSGGEGDDFLARRGVIREPLRGLPYTFAGSHPRVVAGLINGELDNLVREAFDCGDADDTFRGMLRAAIDRIQPDVVTSLCAYCIGFEGNSTELSLLVTVVPGSLTPSEAIQAIVELSAVLESYDKRLSALAIEVAEQAISLVDNSGQAEVIIPPSQANPAEEVKSMSYNASPPSGSSVGLAGDQQGAGTFGAFLRIVMDSTPQYFALTCSHVLSSSKMPTTPGNNNNKPSVVCPAERDNSYWWQFAENVIKNVTQSQSTEISQVQAAQAAQAQKLRCKVSRHPLGTIYATSGLRASEDHWILDWALIKLNPNRFSFEQLRNIPLPSSRAIFETNLNPEAWNETDWTPRAEHIAAPTKGSYLFKIGRTTGHTVGQFHHVDASVTINYILDGPDGKRNILVKGKALVVRPGEDSAFARRGDSGALVLNGNAEAVGMVTAVAKGSVAFGVVYVSPFPPIVDNIKEILQRGPSDGKVEVELL